MNNSFKIMSKVLANKLSPYMNEIILEPQIGFIKGRSIVDGIALVQEVINQCKKISAEGYLLKIDFKNAYDIIGWEVIDEALQGKGIDE